MIGGALAQPATNFPAIFTPGSLFDRFPYLLPNLFSALCVFVGLAVGILFLQETHAEKKWQRDRGLEIGQAFLACLPWNRRRGVKSKKPEKQPLLETDSEVDSDAEEPLPGYRSTESSPRLASTPAGQVEDSLDLENSTPSASSTPRNKPVPTIFTRSVVLNIILYGILAL